MNSEQDPSMTSKYPPSQEVPAVPVGSGELVLLREENRELRIMCAIAHAGLALYHDDGELQDNREHPYIDWKRDPVRRINEALAERAMLRMRAESMRRGIAKRPNPDSPEGHDELMLMQEAQDAMRALPQSSQNA